MGTPLARCRTGCQPTAGVTAHPPQPHFLGAVVFQQVSTPTGDFQTRTVIDGQQRLTTLQVMLDAFQGELARVGADRPALRLLKLVKNDEEYCNNEEDQFKVWPTNRDRPAFYEVMSAPAPVDYTSLDHKAERLPSAHRFFSAQAAEWLGSGTPEELGQRAEALEKAVRELLQIVVIDLTPDENAQEIFETLNSRGAQLSAADLIKNFVFQRLLEEGADTEAAYEKYWKQFETSFWEKDVSQGRLHAPRSSVFLNHFLISRVGEVITANEVFNRFKTFGLHEAGLPMMKLLQQIHRAAVVYENLINGATKSDSNLTRLDLFSYRTQVIDSEVIKPVLLVLLDPEEAPLPEATLNRALQALESWLVRRILVRATTKSYTKIVADIVDKLRRSSREEAAECIVSFLKQETSDASYWPDDVEVRQEVAALPIFRRIPRGRTRMIFEALEDHRRGWDDGRTPAAEQRVPRGTLTIEHLIPQSWESNWPLGANETEASRNDQIHRLGNLTLLTGKLNSGVSNGAWSGPDGKRSAIDRQGTLLLNRDLVKDHPDEWTAVDAEARTAALTNDILSIWPVPEGHRVQTRATTPTRQVRIGVADLLDADLLSPGTRLVFKGQGATGRVAIILADGRIEVDDGTVWATLSGAGKQVAGVGVNGWHNWTVENSGLRMNDYWYQYMEQFAADEDAVESAEDE